MTSKTIRSQLAGLVKLDMGRVPRRIPQGGSSLDDVGGVDLLAMARCCGLNQSAVSRIWRAFALQPHRVETFQLSKNPLFIDKVRDIVGLYLGPPDKALVLCVDEKAQIQALGRTNPLLPVFVLSPSATARTIMSGTEPPRCLRLWMLKAGKSSGSSTAGTR